jgi:hypothetical protein
VKEWKQFLIGSALALLMLVGVFTFACSVAHAAGDVAHVTIASLPTQYTDDSALTLGDIQEIHVQWFRPGATDKTGEQVLPPTQLVVDIPGLKCGDYRFIAFVVTTATARFPNQGGPSTNGPVGGPVPYVTGVSCNPKAPSLTVQ